MRVSFNPPLHTVAPDMQRALVALAHAASEQFKAGESRMDTPSLDETNNRSKAVQKTPWRVDLDSMEKRVASVEYINPESIPHATIAIVILDNGYALQGWSAPAYPVSFNVELGQQYAYEDAMRKMWALEAYVMRDRVTGVITVHNKDRWTQNS